MSLVGFPEFPVFISPADSLVLGWPAPRITPAGRHTLHSRSPPLPPAVTPTVSPGFTTHPPTHISARPATVKYVTPPVCSITTTGPRRWRCTCASCGCCRPARSTEPSCAPRRCSGATQKHCWPHLRQGWECLHCTGHTLSLSSDDVRFNSCASDVNGCDLSKRNTLIWDLRDSLIYCRIAKVSTVSRLEIVDSRRR